MRAGDEPVRRLLAGRAGLQADLLPPVLDPTSQLLLLEKGDADIARGLTGEQLESLKSNPDVTVQEVPRAPSGTCR